MKTFWTEKSMVDRILIMSPMFGIGKFRFFEKKCPRNEKKNICYIQTHPSSVLTATRWWMWNTRANSALPTQTTSVYGSVRLYPTHSSSTQKLRAARIISDCVLRTAKRNSPSKIEELSRWLICIDFSAFFLQIISLSHWSEIIITTKASWKLYLLFYN